MSDSSVCSGSGSDSEDGAILQDMDKLSVLDFDIEETEETSSPEGKQSPDGLKPAVPVVPVVPVVQMHAGDRDTSYFSSLLANPAKVGEVSSLESPEDKNKSSREQKLKKFPKLSQKERKRLSVDSAEKSEPAADAETAKSPTKPWAGWNSPASVGSGAPSLTEIMQIQEKRGVQERKLSETEPKPETPVKKGSWKQLDWNLEKSETPPVREVVVNPWNLSRPSADDGAPQLSAVQDEERQRSFSQIMEQDVKEKQILLQARTKSLELTQLEERAMAELQQIYRLQHPGDIVTVSRAPLGTAAAPVWRKTKT